MTKCEHCQGDSVGRRDGTPLAFCSRECEQGHSGYYRYGETVTVFEYRDGSTTYMVNQFWDIPTYGGEKLPWKALRVVPTLVAPSGAKILDYRVVQ